MKTAAEIAREDRKVNWRPHRVKTTKEIAEYQYRDIEPGIRDVVRFLIEQKIKTVFSCGGHKKNGAAWSPYSWGKDVDRFIHGNPYVVIALGRKSDDYRWCLAAETVFSLLMRGFGPLKVAVPAKIRQSKSSIVKVLAPGHGFNSERSKQRENGGRP
jgi:hypothetical protein